MILSPMNVELTKVHYYESFRKHRNRIVAHNNRVMNNEINDNNINISRNIFGQKSWTFNVTAADNNFRKSTKSNLIQTHKLAMIVTSCIIVALLASITMATVIYLNKTDYKEIIPTTNTHDSSIRIVTVFDQSALDVESVLQRQRQQIATDDADKMNVCHCKTPEEVCLRQIDGGPLQCLTAKDVRDPSGCGGLCALNTQHCRLLDKRMEVYECVDNTEALRCPFGYFNCGDALCVHEDVLCDGNVDCPDLSDEANCPCDLDTHFHCGKETSCLPKWKHCNGVVDCWDTTDEVECPARKGCAPGQLSCVNSTQCFHIAQFCDGRFDCTDKSDEICS